MMKEVIDSLKEHKKKVEKEIDEHKTFSIKTSGKEKLVELPINGKRDAKNIKIGNVSESTTETHILGQPISKKFTHTMMGKKIGKQ